MKKIKNYLPAGAQPDAVLYLNLHLAAGTISRKTQYTLCGSSSDSWICRAGNIRLKQGNFLKFSHPSSVITKKD